MSNLRGTVLSFQPPSIPEQIEMAKRRRTHSFAEELRRRAEVFARLHGALNEEDGEAFEQAMLNAHQIEAEE